MVAETGFVIIVECVLFGSRAILAPTLLPFGILVIYPCENDINFNRVKVDTISSSAKYRVLSIMTGSSDSVVRCSALRTGYLLLR